MRIKFVVASLAISLTMFAAAAMAQQTQPNSAPQPGRQKRHMKMGGGGMHGMDRAFRQLNLTDQQRQQIHSIMQTQFQSTQSQRQELRQLMEKRRAGTLTADETARLKELRQQLRQGERAAHTQLMAVLTPEQKTQLQEIIKTSRENRGKPGTGKQPFI